MTVCGQVSGLLVLALLGDGGWQQFRQGSQSTAGHAAAPALTSWPAGRHCSPVPLSPLSPAPRLVPLPLRPAARFGLLWVASAECTKAGNGFTDGQGLSENIFLLMLINA